MRFPRPRYSLRIFLIVITLVACFLGYHLRIKNQRQAMLAVIKAQGGEFITYEAFQDQLRNAISGNILINLLPREMLGGEEKQHSISQVRQWLGDEPIAYIKMSSGSKETVDRVVELFPEAVVSSPLFRD